MISSKLDRCQLDRRMRHLERDACCNHVDDVRLDGRCERFTQLINVIHGGAACGDGSELSSKPSSRTFTVRDGQGDG